jgi:Mg2+ and Co2+ transporter CorA
MENAKDYEILSTNLQPFFWRKVKTIIRQNKKGALLEFLLGNSQSDHQIRLEEIEEKIQILQNQLNSLQEKINNLENNLENQILVKEENSNVFGEGPST